MGGVGGGVEEHVLGRERVGWFDLVVGEAPCTQGFLLLGWGNASSAAGPQRSVNPHSVLTCGATATKPTVSEQRPATGSTL